MRRLLTLAVATGLAMALVAGPTAAQEINLGFEIDPVEGDVGDVVDGQVNVDDFNEYCFTTPEELGGDTSVKLIDFLAAWEAEHPNPAEWTPDQATGFVILSAFAALAGGPTGGDPDVPTMLFENSTIIAFVDLVALDLVGERGSFDPATGAGSVIVPDLPPGPAPVAAVCIELIAPGPETQPAFDAALEQAGAIVNADPPPDDLFGALEPVLLGLFTFRSIGLASYCVVDASGECPAEEPLPIDPGGNGTDPAAAVTAAPRFTG